jgi:hypothetical protein
MANDLQILEVKIPAIVFGACPTTIEVTVINVGSDPASFPREMVIRLDVLTSPQRIPASHYEIEVPAESPPILGNINDKRHYFFTDVRFPCAPSAFVKATADYRKSVPDNLRSAPSMEVFVPNLGATPWLGTEIRVGIRDSTGHVTWAPDALCSGATCVAEVIIRNAGCARANSSVTTLDLIDGSGQLITSMSQNTPPIASGGSWVFPFVTQLPLTAAGESITFRGCADSIGAVKPQCDRIHACAEVTLPLVPATAGPILTFFARRSSIFPGEVVPISWRIQNFCRDIGTVTAQIKFLSTVLYSSPPIPIGLQDAPKGEDPDLDPAQIPTTFYKIGISTLTLEITGTGTDGKNPQGLPYKATTPVTVDREPVSGAWVFISPTPGLVPAFPWKGAYTVEGRLTNPAHAPMTPSSVVLNETSNVGSPIARIAIPSLATTAIVPGAFGSAIWLLMGTWSWVVPGMWVQTGPSVGLFSYNVTFAMQDAYGNAYPPITSSSEAVAVVVSQSKVGFAVGAELSTAIAIGCLIAGFLALAGIITAVGAPALFAAAGVAFTIAGGLGLAALDPPVPNFDYRSIGPTKLPELPAVLKTQPALAPLLPVLALLWRISRMAETMSATEARLIAARIDRDPSAIQLQASEYRSLRDSILAAARHIPLAVVEAIDGIRKEPLLRPLANIRVLRQQAATWSRRGLPAKLRRAWIEGGLPEQQLKEIERALRTPEFVVRPIDVLLSELTQASALIARGIQDEAEGVLHLPSAET